MKIGAKNRIKRKGKKGTKKKINAQFVNYRSNHSFDLVRSRIWGGTNNNKSELKDVAQFLKSSVITLHNSYKDISRAKDKLINCCKVSR